MIATLLALVSALGAHLAYTAVSFGWRGLGLGPRAGDSPRMGDGSRAGDRPRAGGGRGGAAGRPRRTGQGGPGRAGMRELAAATAVMFAIGSALAFAVFGGLAPAVAIGGFAASLPAAAHRARLADRRQRGQEAWPRMIEEIRVQTGSLGRSIPQALFDVGRRGPAEMRPAFEAAHREWLLTTDLARTFAVLKDLLADPTADMACETLLVAHEIGGADLDRRLEALAADRRQDVQGRKDARARQAGARFARLFVLAVPAGMALAGMSIGNGRAAYQSGPGQAVVLAALVMVLGCWTWAGRVMRLPPTERVFGR